MRLELRAGHVSQMQSTTREFVELDDRQFLETVASTLDSAFLASQLRRILDDNEDIEFIEVRLASGVYLEIQEREPLA